MVDHLQNRFQNLLLRQIYDAGCHSRSQLYKWHQAILDRKSRCPKVIDEKLIEDTARVISDFPHFGGAKGQAYMLYHGIGLIGQKAYDGIKKSNISKSSGIDWNCGNPRGERFERWYNFLVT